jgi:hypothetical protein
MIEAEAAAPKPLLQQRRSIYLELATDRGISETTVLLTARLRLASADLVLVDGSSRVSLVAPR